MVPAPNPDPIAMRLVIVESPKKARTIGGFLGAGYRVAASMGHVRDLPAKELGIDVAAGFAPTYVTLPRAQSSLASLRKAAREAESVLLATDPDREGEAIAWHLTQALRLPKSRYRRISFHEISKPAIQAALAQPRDLDTHLIDAQQARRVLDRLVGYQLSPLLWRKVQRGTSAGRVQSVAVKLIVDREREILAFVPEEYWTIDVRLSTDEEETFLARLVEVNGKKAEIADAEIAERLRVQLEESAYRVRDVTEKDVLRSPFPPFTTSTLQQAAGNRLRLPAKKTMSLAQSLYEAGLITYMRTDSVAISSAAITDVRRTIGAEFGPEYVPASPRRYATRAKNAQEAHEAIRPVHASRSPALLRTTLPSDEHRLYTLIWQRTLASQMPPSKYHQTTALVDGIFAVGPGVESNGGPGSSLAALARSPDNQLGIQGSAASPGRRSLSNTFLLRATASELTFPGWLKVYGEDSAPQATDTDAPNPTLPPLSKDQVVYPEEVLPTQHFTQPPRRYTEPALVKALEDAGVGRPSTYASVVSTIQDRGYVQLQQRTFLPTELGFAANDFLVTHFPKIVDLPFTAEMEDALDEIAGGRKEWREMLEGFYGPFKETLDRAAGAPLQRVALSAAPGGPTPKARTRPSAPGVPSEDGAFTRPPARPLSRARRPLTPSDVACPQCGKPLVERRSQFGEFLGCSGYPACRYIHRDPSQSKKPFKRTRSRKTAAGPPSPRTKHVVRGRASKSTTTRARKKAT